MCGFTIVSISKWNSICVSFSVSFKVTKSAAFKIHVTKQHVLTLVIYTSHVCVNQTTKTTQSNIEQ